MSDIKPFIALPTYDKTARVATIKALDNATKRLGWISDAAGSLLTSTFNQLFVTALNTGATHFVMCHADVVPMKAYWADVLIDELERMRKNRGSARALGTVIAIKDNRGLTSTAVDNWRDPWHPKRRLTLKEVWDLEVDTFGTADLQGRIEDVTAADALLINTGCMVMDLRDNFFDGFCFTILDQIYRTLEGEWVADVTPEDWNMSRWIHAHGGRCFATRALSVQHHGSYEHPNNRVWGSMSTDEHAFSKTGVS